MSLAHGGKIVLDDKREFWDKNDIYYDTSR